MPSTSAGARAPSGLLGIRRVAFLSFWDGFVRHGFSRHFWTDSVSRNTDTCSPDFHMPAFDMFKHPSLEFCSIITVSTSPNKASVSCSFLPHLHLNHRFVSISATSTLDGGACVGVVPM